MRVGNRSYLRFDLAQQPDSCVVTRSRVNERGELVAECSFPIPAGLDPEALQRIVSDRLAAALRAERPRR